MPMSMAMPTAHLPGSGRLGLALGHLAVLPGLALALGLALPLGVALPGPSGPRARPMAMARLMAIWDLAWGQLPVSDHLSIYSRT